MSFRQVSVNHIDRLIYRFGWSVVSTYVALCYFRSSRNNEASNGSLIANPLPIFPLPLVGRHLP
ncbi:MAG: hypothetical protein N2235_22900 [Fischerella sp.]|nr:hypothetical protein [Fischerella sp.]